MKKLVKRNQQLQEKTDKLTIINIDGSLDIIYKEYHSPGYDSKIKVTMPNICNIRQLINNNVTTCIVNGMFLKWTDFINQFKKETGKDFNSILEQVI